MLIDFTGAIRKHRHFHYSVPDLGRIRRGLSAHVRSMIETLPEDLRVRLTGVGVALPRYVEEWPRPGWNRPAVESWANVDFEDEIRAASHLPTFIQNDITAAAGAEAMFGMARNMDDFLYLFVSGDSEFRLVLNHRIYAGRGHEDRVSDSSSSNVAQVGDEFRIVSLVELERALDQVGLDGRTIWQSPTQWSQFGPTLDEWISQCATSVARAIASIGIFVDFRTAIIGGRIPDDVRVRLAAQVGERSKEYLRLDENAPDIVAGNIGAFAKAVGAASLAFQAKFMVDQIGLTAM